jgi:peptide/nickel transport system substrate-binding protein
MGIKMRGFVDKWEAVDAKTFRMVLKEPYGLVLDSLGKPSSNVPFIMPKRFADTPGDKQLGPDEQIGSGPYVFKRDEFKPGELSSTRSSPATSRAASRRRVSPAARRCSSTGSSG